MFKCLRKPDKHTQIGSNGAINVSLALSWSKPNEEPVYTNISIQAATDTATWSERLEQDDRLWFVGKLDTTAIFGERLVILDHHGDWLKVAVISQHTEQNKQGYPGWVLADQVSCNPLFIKEQLCLSETIIAVPKATLFSDSALTKPLGILSYQTRLPILMENEFSLKVRLPNGHFGFLSRKETKKNTELFFSNQNIVKEARQFLDLKYLWGGTSSYGFDCSGFMFRLYQSQGILIPRDAAEQAGEGVPISKEDLLPGDLLFFAKDNASIPDPNKIHHVGMYSGEGLMLHSPNSKSMIRIEPFETGIYGKEYWGARRYCSSSL